MLRGLSAALILTIASTAVVAGDALERARRSLPPATRETLEREHAAALAASESRAAVQARITRDAPQTIADRAWIACGDEWARVSFTFGGIRSARGEEVDTIDGALADFGRTADLLRADRNAEAPAIIARARRSGPPL